MSTLFERYSEVLRKSGEVAAQCGRNPADILLLPVSKTFPAEDIRELYRHGVRRFGENRLQELTAKVAELPEDLEWHFIGTLQSNKVKKVVRLASWIHSVNSIPLLEQVEKAAAAENREIHFLLELNVSGEVSKLGAGLAGAEELIDRAGQCRAADFQGFMTMAPAAASETECEVYFRELAAIRDRAECRLQRKIPVLSMGMSGDYPAAIRAGSTLIRVGSAIFGAR